MPEQRLLAALPPLATGIEPLDGATGGLPRGAVTEIIAATGSVADPVGRDGVLTLLLPVIARLTGDGRTVACIDGGRAPDLFPPALAAAGVDLARLILLCPRNGRDAQWAAEQCARSTAVALTIAPLVRLRDLDIRRLAVAAEAGGGALVLLRPASEADRIVSAALRLGVRSIAANASRAIRIEVLRCRGTLPPPPFVIEVNHDQTLAVPAAAAPELRPALA
jgi:hypothetical protein